MSILRQIQKSIVREGADLGSVLLKLRLLAARLGSEVLEEWVRHESVGYPKEAELPDYRIIDIRYEGTFFGSFGSGLTNAPIPSYLIEKFAGKNWTDYKIRQSIAAVDELVKKSADGSSITINTSNLILVLQGKIYKDLSCNDIIGTISHVSLSEIQQAVRSRVLELTIEIEKSIPTAVNITFDDTYFERSNSDTVQQISQQIIYGNVNSAIFNGHGANIVITIEERNRESLIEYLKSSGITENDATEFATIVESEEPISKSEPLGHVAKSWISCNLKKAAEGTWNIGIHVAEKLLTHAALKFYGLM